MLRELAVRGFKSLVEIRPIILAPLTLFLGPNAAGKSNLLDALQVLSRMATANTLAEALGPPVRGLPLEAFTFPEGGLPALLARSPEDPPRFRLWAEVADEDGAIQYGIDIAINPLSGVLTVRDEYLARCTQSGNTQGKPVIEIDRDTSKIRVR